MLGAVSLAACCQSCTIFLRLSESLCLVRGLRQGRLLRDGCLLQRLESAAEVLAKRSRRVLGELSRTGHPASVRLLDRRRTTPAEWWPTAPSAPPVASGDFSKFLHAQTELGLTDFQLLLRGVCSAAGPGRRQHGGVRILCGSAGAERAGHAVPGPPGQVH